MKVKTKRKITHTLVLFAFGIIVFIWGLCMFWWLFPYKTSTQIQPYKVINKEVKQGELLFYELDYCKYTDKIPKVERQFVDGIIYAVPQGNAQIKKGCGKTVNSIQIPKALPVGNYYMQATVTFKMNPIREISKVYKTEMFKVIK